MKKIAIYEMHGHQSFLFDIIKLLEPLSNEIHVFTTKNILNHLLAIDKSISNNLVLHIYNGKFMFFFNIGISIFTKKCDLFIANSLIGGMRALLNYSFLVPRCKYILGDALLGDSIMTFNLFLGKTKLGHIIKRFLYNIHIKRANILIYTSQELTSIIEKEINKNTIFLPFTFFRGKSELNVYDESAQPLFITITGGIEQRRKNYNVFFKSLNLLINDSSVNMSKYKFIFLGTPKNVKNRYGYEIINKAREINKSCKYQIIKFFETIFIEESTYRYYINKTHIILNPLNMDYYNYGKFSSGMSESISYGIPGIYPSDYIILDGLKSSSLFYYDAKSLYNTIKSLINNKKQLARLYFEAHNNSKKFSYDNFRPSFIRKIQSI